MDLLDFSECKLYFEEDLPPEAEALLAQAAQEYGQPDAEIALLRANLMVPDNLTVLVGLYRFYFYQHRLEEALRVAERAMYLSGRQLSLPDWESLDESSLAIAALAKVKQWESPGNQVTFAEDVSRVVEYNILDTSTEGDLLNRYGVSYYARTILGGFSLLGNRSITGKFISYVGLEDAISRKLVKAGQKAMAKNLTKSFMDQEVKRINDWLQTLVADETIPGGSVYLHPELNSVEKYKNGTWFIVIDYGRYAPNEHMVYQLNARDEIIEQFLEDVL